MGFTNWRGARHRIRTAVGSVTLAAVMLFSGMVQAIPTAAADSVGELVVQPVAGKSLKDVNDRFQTTTQIQFVDTNQGLVKASAVKTTLALMQADAKSSGPIISWAEENVKADDPRAQDDSGADPFCPAPPPDVPTQTKSQDDSGADQRCTKIVLLTVRMEASWLTEASAAGRPPFW